MPHVWWGIFGPERNLVEDIEPGTIGDGEVRRNDGGVTWALLVFAAYPEAPTAAGLRLSDCLALPLR